MDTAYHARRRRRLEDGFIYKAMAVVVAFVFVSILALRVGSALHLSSWSCGVLFFVGMFVFDLGWDFALLSTGRGEMLPTTLPSHIVGRGVVRWLFTFLPIGLAYAYLEAGWAIVAGGVIGAWGRDVGIGACRLAEAAIKTCLSASAVR